MQVYNTLFAFNTYVTVNNENPIFLFSPWLIKAFSTHPSRKQKTNKKSKQNKPPPNQGFISPFEGAEIAVYFPNLIKHFSKEKHFQAKTPSKIYTDLFVLKGKQLGFYNMKLKWWYPGG